MRVDILGGGPGGLYAAVLLRRQRPEARVRVFERNRVDDTYGFGVVFSDETLDTLAAADPESFAGFAAGFRRWTTIATHVGGRRIVSTGHGFAALSRRELLGILHARCQELGVEVFAEHEVASLDEHREADAVIIADGAHSRLRDAWADRFAPNVEWGSSRFCWLGAALDLDAFTFHFRPTPRGLFQVHAYPYAPGRATWIVECAEATWQRAGLREDDEAATVAHLSALFAEELGGRELEANRSIWRRFPTVRCGSWTAGRVALLGDAAHTAHFSVGSGTKLAMEDAIALARRLAAAPGTSAPAVEEALVAYEEARRIDVLKLQKAAATSRAWFENAERYLAQPPLQFTFNLLTRSKRITYDELAQRDPSLVEAVDAAYPGWVGAPPPRHRQPPMFTPLHLRGLELSNRIVVSPMCQYSAVDGVPGDWHLVHLGSRALGGAGLVIAEMTNVEPEGRITPGCTGLWNDEQEAAWKRIVDFCHRQAGARIALQLGHAGRKGSVLHGWDGVDTPLAAADGGWTTWAPSALPFRPGWQQPREMDRADMDRVREAFTAATERALRAGFDALELHLAHGYLLSEFLSPATNRRGDAYGGDLGRRMRYPLEVVEAVRAVWPEDRPLFARLTATDWLPVGQGMTPEDAVVVARALKAAGCDLIDVSSGGNVAEAEIEYGRMYQVPFAERVRYEAAVPVAAVGALLGADHANTVLAAGRADLAVLARAHLREPYLTLNAAEAYGLEAPAWPAPYLPGRPPRPRG